MPFQPARIFLVDDHPLVRVCLANLVRQDPGLTVCGQAEDLADALAGIDPAPPDVAIVDLSLKTGSGLDLIRALQFRHPDVAIIVLSMHEEDYYVEQALRAGAQGYVTKRESTHQIVAAIHQVLRGGIYVDPATMSRLAERYVGGQPAGGEPGSTLRQREREVFGLIGRGRTTREIAVELNLSIKTVQVYYDRIKQKLGLPGSIHLLREAMRWTEREARAAKPPIAI